MLTMFLSKLRKFVSLENFLLWLLPGIVFGICIGFALGWLAQNGITNRDIHNLLENFLPEAVGMGITVLVIYQVDKFRNSRNQEKELKQELLRQIRTGVNEVAISAIDHLRDKKWLSEIKNQNLKDVRWNGARLEGIDLSFAEMNSADLSNTKLTSANLSNAILVYANFNDAWMLEADLRCSDMEYASLIGTRLGLANLSDAQLMVANLTGALMGLVNLSGADLQSANLNRSQLVMADLSGANLWQANLKEANLWLANLSGANLSNANLRGAILEDTKFNEKTILPDDTTWTPDTNMRRFGCKLTGGSV